ncbi:Adaptive-response sensory-kinase SasA [Firmicutes bacterium ASF500]|nr:Adaptive-response sensory-kinase SasA [Firmicutes bacterium ASF500]
MKTDRKDEYSAFQATLIRRVGGSVALSITIVMAMYLLFWKRRMGNWIVWFLQNILQMDFYDAYNFYGDYFRGNKDRFFIAAITIVFAVLLWRVFRGMTRYFEEINQGIETLLADDENQIQLSPEMLPFERKLNTVKRTLAERKAETALAEQRKDELVMYLAHDIRTPLTSVIGYLNLLEEEPNMPGEQRAKRVHIALEKAYRLEAMINEFFEITRYNSQQITLSKETIDLYYMLVQLSDELSPVFAPRGNTVALHLAEDLTVEADPEKLARVFSNILKNAASYSYPRTEITISAEKSEHEVTIQFQNSGEDIPGEALASLFDKFYRADKSRSSDTGGTGLGLAIAKEIVVLHGGTISATSKNHVVTFTISLPLAH